MVRKKTSYDPLSSPEDWPNIDSIVTEDNEPIDIFSEKQQRFLITSLYRLWRGHSKSFIALVNVGLFYLPDKPPLVPNVLVSLDVKLPDDLWHKFNRSYFVFQYGKPPEVAIEIVSNLKGKEAGSKFKDYAQAKVRYYVIFDPENQLKKGELRIYELHNTDYIEKTDSWLNGIELGLTLWEGYFEDKHDTWLRWYDIDNKVLLTGDENAKKERLAKEQAEKQAEQERLAKEQAEKQAEQERLAKEQEHQRAERLAAQLRAMGIDPDKEG
ncbi:Uma2 family endonuclease [Candidatus Parabeggiatoa sp. HSG14]|uniref:Uma2 family endonuclease n=1 Tax=Candidatus Parabeggiatoa sp. HSG14 TaxID=3055593 RepID=UPI0025A6EC3E|nr:Uma2 family endonuclease [Thiotrichales bacterium HSG14]